MRSVTTRCDRCSTTISEGVSVFAVTATAGNLTNILPNTIDLCSTCSHSLLDWLIHPTKPQTEN